MNNKITAAHIAGYKKGMVAKMKEFKNPSNKFRPIPFWSWNDQLEKDEIQNQIVEMKQAGVGGAFFHARSGLKVDYLGEEWFECIKAGIDKGKEVGLDVWLYDEEGWPSGFAGGIVPALSADYHAKFMTLERYTTLKDIDKAAMLAVYLYDKERNFYVKIDWDYNTLLNEGQEFLAIRRHTNPYYIDTMNKRAVEAFLQCTHEVYFEKYGEDFGTFIKGFFTDEPRLTCNHFGELPWSDELTENFKHRYGYELSDCLPALFIKSGNYEKFRYDFWKLVNDLFVKSYMKTIYDWCEAHGCKSTGHIMMEESIFSQMTSTGGVMPFYEYMHIPGIDWLRRPISTPVIGKQVGSAACQLGKDKVITESFALCGWNVSFEELKWIAEWQFVNGVNMICQHLQAYTIRGSRKRDYPPSLFHQQTWWKDYKKFNDYLGRLCVALSEGNQSADVLLLHPMRSGYVTYDGTRTEDIRVLDDEFSKISVSLSGNHISYHYGDETIIENHGRIEEGQFLLGKIAYKTVILPHMHSIDNITVKLLLEFLKKGGVVLSTGRFPTFTNGSEEELAQLKAGCVAIKAEEIRDYLKKVKLVSLSIAEKKKEISSISYQQRQTREGTLLFLVNHDQKETYQAEVTVFNGSYQVKRLVAETGEEEVIGFSAEKDKTVFTLEFKPMQSYILMLEQTEAPQTISVPVAEYENITLQRDWKIEKLGLNSLTLDTCTYSIDGGEVMGPVSVIRLQDILMELRRPCEVTMNFSFEADLDLKANKEFYLVVEEAKIFNITVNGTPVSYNEEAGYWKDKTFKKVDIKPTVINGRNEVTLHTTFRQSQKVYEVLYGENVYETEKNKITYEVELESIYLLGDFGVVSKTPFRNVERDAMFSDGPFLVVDKPVAFYGNEFTKQGLLFFAEDMVISQNIEITDKNKKYLLDFGKQNAPLIKIFVNGYQVKASLWAPYTADISDYVKDGINEIKLWIYASNRNLLGPHHHIDGECYNVGPDSFTGKWSWVERKSEADATDIADRTKNYWTDSYSFVKFGLKE